MLVDGVLKVTIGSETIKIIDNLNIDTSKLKLNSYGYVCYDLNTMHTAIGLTKLESDFGIWKDKGYPGTIVDFVVGYTKLDK